MAHESAQQLLAKLEASERRERDLGRELQRRNGEVKTLQARVRDLERRLRAWRAAELTNNGRAPPLPACATSGSQAARLS